MDSYVLNEQPKNARFIITAFQTAGYISLLAVKYLEEQKAIKDIGYINIDSMQEFGTVIDGVIQSPIRILLGDSALFVTSQFPLPQASIDSIVQQIIALSKKFKPEYVIALDGIGIDSAKDTSHVYYASNDSEAKLEKVQKLKEGAIIGINSELSFKTKEINVPMLTLMAETHSSIPDGIAASALISVLGQITGMNVDTSKLVSEYKKTISKINEIFKRAQKPVSPSDKENMYG
jgi:predicted ATP-grasp superfamily ATP-dependent carboligase